MMRKSFTLIEIMIVVVIMGIMASLSVPVFTKTFNRARARDAILNLNAIHTTNVLYRVRNGANLTGANNIAAINTALDLNIIANGSTYVCNTGTTCVATGTGFTATATLATPLVAGSNPACAGADCP